MTESFLSPWSVAHQAPLSIGFSKQEYWNRLPCSLPGNLPDPGTEPTSLVFPALAVRFFTTETPGKPLSMVQGSQNSTKMLCSRNIMYGGRPFIFAFIFFMWKSSQDTFSEGAGPLLPCKHAVYLEVQFLLTFFPVIRPYFICLQFCDFFFPFG